jgi:hypothetical protein
VALQELVWVSEDRRGIDCIWSNLWSFIFGQFGIWSEPLCGVDCCYHTCSKIQAHSARDDDLEIARFNDDSADVQERIQQTRKSLCEHKVL